MNANPNPQEPREVMTDAEIDAFVARGAWPYPELVRICAQAKLANAPALPAVSVDSGAKVLNREPTEEMVSAAFLHFNRNTPPTNPSGNWKAALRAAWDAAPSLAPPAIHEGPSNELFVPQADYDALRDKFAKASAVSPPAAREAVVEWPEEPSDEIIGAAQAADFEGHDDVWLAWRTVYKAMRAAHAAVGKAPAAPEVDAEAALHRAWGFAHDHPERCGDGYDKKAFSHVLFWLRELSLAPAAKEKK